ncbi:TPA: conjugal transfer protein TrbJ [Klebsiella pneumoniae]|uniref:conjugal transfer protein TrbJ n=1 Tax=Klebsiella pneumoniae TaxID=573 RepID=UPI00203F0CFE|nr:conjugal transfer protein TrbJ [Klebsiella pneumoniae]USC03972.1 conjugal transfer protein TrbJ [Klebsiella pneumoniae]HBT4848178.1 conjugal transfer protein TrbJ [Klebsiella pneumoniae]HBT4861796.1 conjugal transfer protein TrbJ [Klebsiella pneumoniae]HBT4877498.1 conjugal transfer protein TrbJ [Klebsiella pneumoniae]
MCAKDRSHIAVRSQTDSIHSMREMLNLSSCPAFIRDSRGEVIHTSPTFDKIFLTSGCAATFDTPRAPGSWFLDLSLEVKLELMQSELKSFSDGSAVLVKKIWLVDSLWTVFIETFSIKEDAYSKWVFINEGEPMLQPSREYNDFSKKMHRYIERIQRTAKSDWAIFNLYAVGFSHASISKITGVEVQTSKNTVSKIKKELRFDDRDYIIMSSIYTLSYGKFITNVISILKGGVNFLLNQ